MATTPLQAWPIPEMTDLRGNVPVQMQSLGTAAEKQSVMRFTTATTRDASVTAPEAGMLVYLTTPKQLTLYDGTAWRMIKAPASCMATRSTTQSIAHNTNSVVTFNGAEGWDHGTLHDTVTNPSRITVPTNLGGLWLVGWGGLRWAASASGVRAAWLQINGAAPRYSEVSINGSNAGGDTLSGSSVLLLSPGDYVEVGCFQSSGGALNADGAALPIRFWAKFLDGVI